MYILSLLKILQGHKKGDCIWWIFHPIFVIISASLVKNKPSLSTWNPNTAMKTTFIVFMQHLCSTSCQFNCSVKPASPVQKQNCLNRGIERRFLQDFIPKNKTEILIHTASSTGREEPLSGLLCHKQYYPASLLVLPSFQRK